MRRILAALLLSVGLILATVVPSTAVGAAPADGSTCTQWVRGIDVSKWQGRIDWPAVPTSGVAFAFIKATEGTWYKDPTFLTNAVGAAQAGIPWGAYDFARPDRTDPVAEANYFVDNGGNNGTLPGVLDLETKGGLSAAQVGQWATAWAVQYVERTGRIPLIYVGAYFGADVANLATYLPLWLPSYTAYGTVDPNPCAMRQPVVTAGWNGWSIWQYSSEGRVNGIGGNVDMNVMTPTLYGRLTGVGTAPAPTDPTVDAPWQVFGPGSTGPGVAKIQELLGVTADGIYGPETTAAVAAWQTKLGLPADGVWGRATQLATDSFFAWLASLQPAKVVADAPRPELFYGTGWSFGTVALQAQLAALGYWIPVNGIYDANTAAFVAAFQAKAGLQVNGIYDAPTAAVLNFINHL